MIERQLLTFYEAAPLITSLSGYVITGDELIVRMSQGGWPFKIVRIKSDISAPYALRDEVVAFAKTFDGQTYQRPNGYRLYFLKSELFLGPFECIAHHIFAEKSVNEACKVQDSVPGSILFGFDENGFPVRIQ